MRVLVVTTSYPKNDEDPSGHFVRSSARALASQGHEVHVVAPGGTLFDAPRESLGVTVHRAGGGALFAWPGALARAKESPLRLLSGAAFAAGALSRIARIGRVDRAVAHWIVPSAFPLLEATRAPIEAHAHGADVRLLRSLPRAITARVIGALLAKRTTFVFAARTLLDGLAHALPPELANDLHGAAHVEAPPIDVPDAPRDRGAKRRGLGLADDAKLWVTVSRLVPGKRVELAIEAATEAGQALVVVGDGPERKALEERAASRGTKVVFVGALPRREAIAWIATADVLVHPSAMEGAPSVVREARALGVPVVACDAGDVRAWAEDDRGIVVADASAQAIARCVGEALAF